MSTWSVWKQAFDDVTPKEDGDPRQIRGAAQHGLDASFPNYEVFGRYQIVPATNRSANIDLRKEADREIIRVGTTIHRRGGSQ